MSESSLKEAIWEKAYFSALFSINDYSWVLLIVPFVFEGDILYFAGEQKKLSFKLSKKWA